MYLLNYVALMLFYFQISNKTYEHSVLCQKFVCSSGTWHITKISLLFCQNTTNKITNKQWEDKLRLFNMYTEIIWISEIICARYLILLIK
jgi:hypothetical protein